MKKKDIWMTLGIASAVALSGLCLYIPFRMERGSPGQYLGWAVKAQRPLVYPRPAPMTLDAHVATLLPTLTSDDIEVRRTGLDAIEVAFTKGAAEEISDGIREDAAHSLIDVYDEADESTPEGLALKKQAMRVLVTKVRDENARDFALSVFESDAKNMQTELLKTLLLPGAMRDKVVFAKAYAAARQDFVPPRLMPAIFRRTLGKKAEGEIMALLQTATDMRTLQNCAVEIQNLHKPELLGPVLTRLESAGLLRDRKVLPWFSGKLLSEHIKSADGKELIGALRVVWLRPSLTRSTMRAVQRRLAHADPAIRRLVARIIPDAVKYKGIEPAAGEELLTARLEVETDPVVKGEIEGSLSQVRETRRTKGGMETAPAVVD